MSVTSPLPPGSTVGVLGGGQLGRMLAFAARRMGYRIVSWVGGPDSGPAEVADYVIEEPFDSPAGLAAFLERAQVATVEFENIPRSLLEAVAAKIPLMPGTQAVAICQHREREKRFPRGKRHPPARVSPWSKTRSSFAAPWRACPNAAASSRPPSSAMMGKASSP
jgi:5-(carboxyamino)imidazole ribonucleotide synthase